MNVSFSKHQVVIAARWRVISALPFAWGSEVIRISSIDANGIVMAAIQDLKLENDHLRKMLDHLKLRLEKSEQQ